MYGWAYRQKNGTGGFTLIEMLVVVIMVGVIAAIAAPSWLSFLTRQRLNSTRSDLLAVLRSAQEEAQSRQQSKSVIFSPSDFSVTVRNASDTTGGVTTVLGRGEINDSFSLVASTTLTFGHDGGVDTAPYTVKITHDDSSAQSCVIVTTLLGSLKASSNQECDSFNGAPF